MKLSKWAAGWVAMTALVQMASAGPPPPPLCTSTPDNCALPQGGFIAGAASRTDHRAFAGLVWELGGDKGNMPNLVLGVSSLRVKSDSSVSGGELSLSLDVFKRQNVDSVKLYYVGGSRDVQGKLGAGYSFEFGQVLASLGLQGSHLLIGSDYVYGVDQFKPFFGVNTFGRPQAVEGGSNVPLTCAQSYRLVPNDDDIGAPPDRVKDGQTCIGD
jgi:hypothetical protein